MGNVIRTEFGQVFEEDEDFEIEVSDLRTGVVSGRDAWRIIDNGKGIATQPPVAASEADAEAEVPETPYRSPFASYLSQRQRTCRAAISLGVVLAAFLAITLVATPFIYAGLKPAAAQPVPRATDRFYFVSNVPWGAVVLDGHNLVRLPMLGDSHPLRLAQGTHTLEWLADPFMPFHCTVSVPHSYADTCGTQPLTDSSGTYMGTLITEHESLLSLNLDQLVPLRTAIMNAVESVSTSATIQPGEHYRHPFIVGDPQSGRIATADAPLKAAMHFVAMVQTGFAEPCSVLPSQPSTILPCRAPGQDCREICTLSSPDRGRIPAKQWLAAITARVLWRYSTLNDTVITQDAASYGFDLTLVVLRIAWDGTQWHVTPIIGDADGMHLAAANDASCGAAREWLQVGIAQNEIKSDLATIMSGVFSATTNAVTGCVVTLPLPSSVDRVRILPSSPLQVEAPIFLERFGVLLAANDAAHTLWPTLPQANAHERMIADTLSQG